MNRIQIHEATYFLAMFPSIVKTALEKKILQHLLPETTVKQNLVEMLFEDVTKKGFGKDSV